MLDIVPTGQDFCMHGGVLMAKRSLSRSNLKDRGTRCSCYPRETQGI